MGDLRSCAACVATLVRPSRLLTSSPSFTSFMRGARSPAMRFTCRKELRLSVRHTYNLPWKLKQQHRFLLLIHTLRATGTQEHGWQ